MLYIDLYSATPQPHWTCRIPFVPRQKGLPGISETAKIFAGVDVTKDAGAWIRVACGSLL